MPGPTVSTASVTPRTLTPPTSSVSTAGIQRQVWVQGLREILKKEKVPQATVDRLVKQQEQQQQQQQLIGWVRGNVKHVATLPDFSTIVDVEGHWPVTNEYFFSGFWFPINDSRFLTELVRAQNCGFPVEMNVDLTGNVPMMSALTVISSP